LFAADTRLDRRGGETWQSATMQRNVPTMFLIFKNLSISKQIHTFCPARLFYDTIYP